MSKFLDYLLGPLGCLVVFLLGIGYNIIADVPAVGLGRLVALIPSLVLLLTWILTSLARSKSGK